MLQSVRPSPFPTLAMLADALADLPPPELEGAAIEAAVLVCLHDDAVLLARRALHPEDPWSGHAALPGGRWEPGDESLLATALREAREELGIELLDHGRLLGALGTHVGRGRRVSGVRIAVFVAALDERPPLQLSAELDAVYWVPLASLVPVTARVAELPDDDVPAYALELPGAETLVVWGITYAILERLRALAASRFKSRGAFGGLDRLRLALARAAVRTSRVLGALSSRARPGLRRTARKGFNGAASREHLCSSPDRERL